MVWPFGPMPGEVVIGVADETWDNRKLEGAGCGHIYEERLGAPEDGIAPGTRWEDVPESCTCPDCGAAKADFQLAKD